MAGTRIQSKKIPLGDMNNGVKSVAAKHIGAGIEKYGGIIDAHITSLIKAAGLQYTPYVFKDGRVLLVLPDNLGAFLYNDKETMYAALSLTS